MEGFIDWTKIYMKRSSHDFHLGDCPVKLDKELRNCYGENIERTHGERN